MFALSLRLTTQIIQPVHLSPFRLADIAKYKPKSKSLTLGCNASKSGAHCRLPDNQFLYLSIPVLLVANHTIDAEYVSAKCAMVSSHSNYDYNTGKIDYLTFISRVMIDYP